MARDIALTTSGWKDHHLRMSSVICLPVRTGVVDLGQGAPMLTHCDRVSISRGGELRALGRHLQVAGLVDGLEEQALFGVADDDGRAGFAALEHLFAGVEAEAARGFVHVAGGTVVGEDGADVVLEEVVAGAGLGLGRCEAYL